MKERTLAHKLMARFAICLMAMLVLSIPLLYYITVRYYAEDLIELVSKYGIHDPQIDLEEDTFTGLLIQLSSIVIVITLSVLIIMRWVPQRLWRSFHQTLHEVSTFKVESGVVPQLPTTDISEFRQLNDTLTRIMTDSVRSYKVQKEFTENASHELQTPLAIAQVKLDNLMQDETLTERQASEIQQVYDELRHMSQLSRNLLLLSKIENNQFKEKTSIVVADEINALLPHLETIAGDIRIQLLDDSHNTAIACNHVLLGSMLTNLVVNAVRHNKPNGLIHIHLTPNELTVANTSDDPPLDPAHIFSRFYRTPHNQKSNGLGLAIVKSICDYHQWTITYHHTQALHQFTVRMR